LAFLGDSITEGWLTDGCAAWEHSFSRYKPLNLGIGGDETGQVLWRIANGELDGIHPKALVLLIGTNNIGNEGQTGADAAEGVQMIVQEIRARLPKTKVLLLAVLPRDEQPDTKFRKEVSDLNAKIRLLDDGKTVQYLDLASTFLNADGTLPRELFPDTLHLSAQAYERWAEAMMPVLKPLMK
jgi:beta-glucosidase